ncbi:MAG: VPA1269 family protein [Pedobacter sp.]
MNNHTSSVTDNFVVKNGFTYCDDFHAWCVLRGLNDAAIQSLKKTFLLKKDLGINYIELSKKEKLLECVELLLQSKNSKLRLNCFRIFVNDGALLAPMGPPTLGPSQTNVLIPKGVLEKLCKEVTNNCEIHKIDRDAKFALGKLWTGTKEGREKEINKENLKLFLELFYRQSKMTPGHYTYRDAIPSRHAAAIKFFVGHLDMREHLQRPKRSLTPEFFAQEHPEGQKWIMLFEEFCREQGYGAIEKIEFSFNKLCTYLHENPEVASPSNFFSRKIPRKKLSEWLKETGNKSIDKDMRMLRNFFNWIASYDDTIAVRDPISDELIIRPECFIPITDSEINAVSNSDYERPAETVQLALPLEYLEEVEIILTEDNMAWPKSCKNEWVNLKDPESGEIKEVFCPVLPNLIRIMIKLPLRHIQPRRLDSGEGDDYYFDLKEGKFVPNHGPFAGYWKKKGVKNPERGVLRKIEDNWNGKSICGFYINSNKLTDRKTGFDETSGYVISWQNEAVIEIMQEMRAWQEYWNPVQAPTKYVNLRPKTFPKMQKDVAKRRPDTFYLFRYPAGQAHAFPDSPPSGDMLRFFWFKVLAELERRLKERGEDPPELISSWNYSTPTASPYTLHGLRHSGLTRMAEAGVHPWILKNIVAGHADYVMTLYYIKPRPTHISDYLNEKYEEAMSKKQNDFVHFLGSKNLEEVHRNSVAASGDAYTALQQIKNSVKNAAGGMSKLDHGVCPNGRTRCHEGVLLDSKKGVGKKGLKHTFAPTPTVMGAPDCTQCRFWITGTPFADGLRIKTNEVSFATHKAATRYRDMLEDLKDLESEKYQLEKEGNSASFKLNRQIQSLKQEIKTESEILSALSISLNSHGEKWQEVRALLRVQYEDNDPDGAYLLYDEEPKFEWGLLPKFQAIDELAHAAKWFPSVRNEDISRERKEKIVQMLVRNGKPPIIAMMTDKEAETAINAFTARLYSRLDRQAVRKLFEGQETFESLGMTKDVESIMTETLCKQIDFTTQVQNSMYLGSDEIGC